jgi:hypothetical protein
MYSFVYQITTTGGKVYQHKWVESSLFLDKALLQGVDRGIEGNGEWEVVG